MGKVGATFSEGFLILRTKAPVTLNSVEIRGGDEALEYLGARLVLPGRRDDFYQFVRGFPPPVIPARYQREVVGSVLMPDEGYLLIFGSRIRKHVMDLRREVVVNYRNKSGERYSRTYPAGVVTCPPPDAQDCSEIARRRYGDILKDAS